MDRRTAGIIGIVVSSLLCALPGLAGLCVGPLGIFGSVQPDYDAGVDPTVMIGLFVSMTCLSVVFIAIPIVIGFVTFGKPKPKLDDFDEPIPVDDF